MEKEEEIFLTMTIHMINLKWKYINIEEFVNMIVKMTCSELGVTLDI